MKFLNYHVINTGQRARVTAADCDASEQAGIIDRTLLPVLATGQGRADSRKSGYSVRGEIKSNSSTFVLFDDSAQIATLAVCLHAKKSTALWQWLHAHAESLPQQPAPAPAWAALRYDAPAVAMPNWLGWWAQHVGYALLTREGW